MLKKAVKVVRLVVGSLGNINLCEMAQHLDSFFRKMTAFNIYQAQMLALA